jgi:acetyl-CoA carboxylase carboxyl transferase subunit alpha
LSSCTATAASPTTKAIVGGLARFNGQACMVIGHQKGATPRKSALRNFGMPRPRATARRCG